MSDVKVSVIIPVYNAEKYLRECLNSVVNQTLREIEVICVDDGSTNDSLAILREYEAKDERVKVLQQKNQYAGVARNKGINIAQGEYLLFLDSDDFFERKMLEEMYHQAQAFSADICLCGDDRYNTVTHTFSEASWYLNTAYIKTPSFSRKTLGNNIFKVTSPAPWTKLFRAEFIRYYGLQFMGLPRTNDLYFVESAMALANSIVYVNKPFVHYRVGQQENLQSNNHLTPFCFCDALWELKKKLYQEDVFPEVAVGFSNLVLRTAVFNIKSLEAHKEVQEQVLFAFENLYASLFSLTSKNLSALDSCNVKKYSEWIPFKKQVCCPRFSQHSFDTPKVSVIIPIYKVEDYIADCVYSVITQTLKEIEIICVNDGSPDNSRDCVLHFMELDKRIRLVDKPNGGLSSARNVGLKNAKGEYIYFLDSDDYLEPTALETLYNKCKENNLEVLDFNARSFFETEQDKINNKNYISYYNRTGDYPDVYTGMELFMLMQDRREQKPSACLHIISKKLYEDNGISFCEGIIHEDNIFTYQILKAAKRVGYISDVFYNRRVHSDSTMTTPKSNKNVYGYFVAFYEALKDVINGEFSENECDAVGQWLKSISRTIFNIYSTIPEKDMSIFFLEKPQQKILFDVCFYQERCLKNQLAKAQDELSRTKAELAKAQDELSRTKAELANVRSSTSYRVGRAVTWLPRKSKTTFRVFQNSGIKGVAKVIKRKIKSRRRK